MEKRTEDGIKSGVTMLAASVPVGILAMFLFGFVVGIYAFFICLLLSLVSFISLILPDVSNNSPENESRSRIER